MVQESGPGRTTDRLSSGWGRGMARFTELDRLIDEAGDPHNPDSASILSLFSATRTIAVVGLSRDPLKPARRVPSYLAAKGYLIHPVNPNAVGTRLLGRTVYESLAALTQRVDLVLVFRPSFEAEGVIREVLDRPERPAIWLQESIWGGAATEEARALRRTVVQNLCAFKAHRATGLR